MGINMVALKGWFAQNWKCIHFLLATMSTEAPVTFSKPHNFFGDSQGETVPPTGNTIDACGGHVFDCRDWLSAGLLYMLLELVAIVLIANRNT